MDYVDSMFSVGEVPWHNKGNILSKPPANSEEAMREGGLDWEVDLKPLFAKAGQEVIPIPDSKALMRMDTMDVLKVVSNEYEIIQNSAMFDFIDALIGEDNVSLETAGSLKGGRVVWAMTELKKERFAIKGDENRTYLSISTSHDKSQRFQATVGNVRVVCWNTLRLSLKEASNKYTVRHIGDIDQRIEEAQQALGLAVRWNQVFKEGLEILAKDEIDDSLMEELVRDAFGLEEESQQYDTVYDTLWDGFYQVGDEVPALSDSRYAALQAVTRIVDYGARVTPQAQVAKIVVGTPTGNHIKEQAFNILMGN